MTARSTVFDQIYLTGAVLAFAASFAPLWVPADDADPGTDIGTYSLWTVIPADQGGAAVLGVLLVVSLVAVAVIAAALPDRSPVAPVLVLVLGAAAVAMLLTKPGTGTPEPVFGPGAGLMFGTALFLAATAVADLLTPRTSAATTRSQP